MSSEQKLGVPVLFLTRAAFVEFVGHELKGVFRVGIRDKNTKERAIGGENGQLEHF